MGKNIYLKLVTVAVYFVLLSCSGNQEALPVWVKKYIASIEYGQLGNTLPEIHYSKVTENILKATVVIQLEDSVHQDDWQVNIQPSFMPDFHWAPHLTPTNDHIIAQHAFRAPAVIVASEDKKLTIIPNLDLLGENSPVEWYMDMNATQNSITLGMSRSEVREHVLFVRKPGAVFPPGTTKFGFYIIVSDNEENLSNPFREAVSFLWDNWGENAFHSMAAGFADPEKYVEHTYNWAFNSWKKNVWQEFKLDDKIVGAPVFIVNTTQSPNYPGQINEREFKSIWNQAWFNSLRSASGLYRYAKRKNNKDLLSYALKTKELALAFPQNKGFFPAVIGTEMEQVEIDGESYNRSKGWNTYSFGNSNRNPYTWDWKASPLHILDMSFTANQMLMWYNELEEDQRLLDYAYRYGEALIEKQLDNGYYPGWIDNKTHEPLSHLNDSPESSMSVVFLLNLFKITKQQKFLESALKAMEAITNNIIYQGRWEDFETYWSCSRYGSEDLVGKKVSRNNQYKQNTLSIYWTAEALLECYNHTGDKKFLSTGERTIDELLMYQAAWQPPYIYVRTLGGFAVMNADGEWNDSRQSLFAELIIQYGEVLNRDEYKQRGIAALLASFEMMYCPENNATKEQWEKAWPFFNEKDYGFMMENYGHGGVTSSEGTGIGEFTIYDWGNGAASEAYNRIIDHWGKSFIEMN